VKLVGHESRVADAYAAAAVVVNPRLDPEAFGLVGAGALAALVLPPPPPQPATAITPTRSADGRAVLIMLRVLR
jgi:hypothetical protein